MRRAFIASLLAVLAATPPVLAPVPAEAVTVNIQIGTNISGGRSISCQEGSRRLRSRGFRDVRAIDCRGRFFVYRAWRGGSRFEIAINRHTGRVVDMRRLRR
ncbi:hypothetical protein SAMN05892877_102210 [Rhizobium subbaraonis]|uniref:YpeB-like protein with protease inhibitory function n=1 Tax=Rhizobium subbaraonis TaxID=908946 RepID=A0A285U396_9HYPH|nr:hypothetical protein [Rhizobium subbaraonis]SOC35888.1 hypothetical protein SAMN05892877_102210 [Rhizobium subbaraonis]